MSELMVITWNKAFLLLSMTMAVSGVVLAYIYIPPFFLYKPGGKYRIAMAGRSVMGGWFRYWNWPYPLKMHALYVAWPIPHRLYVKAGFYLEYVHIAPPSEDMERLGFGSRTMESLREQIPAGRYDALFFKFCFVDFGDRSIRTEADGETHLERLKQVTLDVHEFTKERKIRMILGNALPVLEQDAKGQWVRKEYNRWLLEYAKVNPDILVFDFFDPLTEGGDTLSGRNAMSPTNSHLSSEAYRSLDERFSETLKRLKR